ncbi:hypothetical protein M404DRAFT_29806 [Pisolithus tinctorius Marx 270]|uniref:Uncharacterized protein n=1 Tax=Pisolithus tinctorius Marx 270 TaxID=870435 RepID=A0A0C3NYH0_PISTI|nr:hypothetical protein M404DRAFT_29806 [Pisolithus tinctorius Marx 270]
MSESRLISTTGNDNEGQVVIDWTQVADDAIRYDTDDEEEVMKAKVKERKRQKVAEQARWEEQARLEAERVAREQAKAERIAWEAEEQRARKEEEKCRAEEEKEAERKHKAKADKGDEAGGEVKKVVMDPGLFELHETTVENSGCIANTLESLLDKSYSFSMAVSPSDSGSSELDSEELCEEAKWLRTHGEDEEEETEGEDEAMAKGE